MKNKEELETLKNEYANLTKKLVELSQDELKEVTGGTWMEAAGWLDPCPNCGSPYKVLSRTYRGIGGGFDYHVRCKNPECGYEWSFILPL